MLNLCIPAMNTLSLLVKLQSPAQHCPKSTAELYSGVKNNVQSIPQTLVMDYGMLFETRNSQENVYNLSLQAYCLV